MKYKQTLFTLITIVMLLCIKGSVAFALQDSTGNKKGRKIEDNSAAGRAAQADEYRENAEEISEEVTEEGAVTNVQEAGDHIPERNSSYYRETVKKNDFNKQKWSETTRDLNYRDDNPEKKEAEEDADVPRMNFSLPIGGAFFKVLVFVIIIAALVFLLYKLLGGNFE